MSREIFSKETLGGMLKTAAWLCVVMSFFAQVAPRSNHSHYCKRKCPAFDPPSGGVHLPGPEKYLFYKCNFGVGVLFRCPFGTYFNPRKQVCDWYKKAHAVKCYGSPNNEFEGSGDSGGHTIF